MVQPLIGNAVVDNDHGATTDKEFCGEIEQLVLDNNSISFCLDDNHQVNHVNSK